jgi:hypothetical protein
MILIRQQAIASARLMRTISTVCSPIAPAVDYNCKLLTTHESGRRRPGGTVVIERASDDKRRAAAEDSDRLRRMMPRRGRIEDSLGIMFVL